MNKADYFVRGLGIQTVIVSEFSVPLVLRRCLTPEF